MSSPDVMATTVPFKTPQGNEELRSRKLKLGQRHRTVLFLIDGKRPLAEVLVLAQKAGAATQHFEDLLRLGLVDLPPEPVLPPEPEAEPVEEIELTSVELPVLEEVLVEEPAEEVSERLATPNERAPLADALRAPDSPPLPLQPDVAKPKPAPADADDDEYDTVADPRMLDDVATGAMDLPTLAPPTSLPPPRPPAPAGTSRRPPVAPPVLKEAVPAPPPSRPFAIAPPRAKAAPVDGGSLDIDLPLPDESEARILQEVRELLNDALRLDAPLFSARTFMRVRNAQSAKELIDLVWEIQDHLTRRRRPRKEFHSLLRARELLGLGNTLVSDESTRPPYLDEE